ncbi:hypothetical protein HDU76_010316, partial [Blyttiomyces sp. JEL0837]
LSFNMLTGELPDGFQYLTKLTQLHLQNNILSGTVDNLSLLNSNRLMFLDVFNNCLTGGLPANVRNIGIFDPQNSNCANLPVGTPPPPNTVINSPSNTPPIITVQPSPTNSISNIGSSSSNGSSTAALSTGGIIGIVVGGLVLVALVVGGFVWVRQRNANGGGVSGVGGAWGNGNSGKKKVAELEVRGGYQQQQQQQGLNGGTGSTGLMAMQPVYMPTGISQPQPVASSMSSPSNHQYYASPQ